MAAARSLDHAAIALGVAAGLLALGLTVQVVQWDATVLSESLALSLFVLAAGLGLLAARPGAGRGLALATAVVVVLWAFARHVNAAALLVAVPVVIGVALWRLPRRAGAAVTVAALVVAAWALVSSGALAPLAPERRHPPGGESCSRRRRAVPTSPSAASGSPRRSCVRWRLAAARPTPIDFEPTILDDPGFRRWFEDEYESAFRSYAVSNLPALLVEGLRGPPAHLLQDPDYADPRASSRGRSRTCSGTAGPAGSGSRCSAPLAGRALARFAPARAPTPTRDRAVGAGRRRVSC